MPRYREVRHPVTGRRTYEHRLVAEQIVGRPLERHEHVHHINGDGLDNRPENLEVLSAREHRGRHRFERCARGHEFTPENTYFRPDGGRMCGVCVKQRSKFYAWKRKAERHARGLLRNRAPLEPWRG